MDTFENQKCRGTEKNCIGAACKQYMKFYSIDKDKKTTKFWQCAFVQTPLLLIELIQTMTADKKPE